MRTAGLAGMGDDSEHREALAAAGYTGARGTVVFCLILGLVGGLLGSVLFAILWAVMLPGSSETLSTIAGIAAGAALGVLVGLMKVRQGNLEAREQVEDREWRRQLRREHGK